MKRFANALILTIAVFFAVAPRLHAQNLTIKDPAEYNEYNMAIGQTSPQAKAAAIEAFLTHYPNSVVFHDMLVQLVQTYSSIPDAVNALSASDRLLAIDPNNMTAILAEVYFKSQQAAQATDPAAKQTLLDSAAGFATTGLSATKPADVADADWAKTKATTTPLFYSAIGSAAYNKGDYATAITNYGAELSSYADPTVTAQPSPALQDTFYLGVAYFKNTPADYVSCVWYTDRAAHFAPPQFQSAFLPTAKYCYNKYHGNLDGFDAVDALESPAQLNPPTTLSITPAPKPADLAHAALQGVTDLNTLALSDKEYVLTNGTETAAVQPTPAPATPATDADTVWATMQGATTKLTDMTVVSATPTVVTFAVSDDAVQNNVADFSVTMKDPLTTVPTPGSKFTLIATFDSYDKSPFLIHMVDGELPPPDKPVHHVHHTEAATH